MSITMYKSVGVRAAPQSSRLQIGDRIAQNSIIITSPMVLGGNMMCGALERVSVDGFVL